MFGPSARQSTGSLRRAKRRLLLIVVGGLVLALIVGEVADDVVNSSGPANRRSAKSWAAAISPILYESNALVQSLRRVLSSPGSFSRPDFDLVVGGLAKATSADVTALGQVGLAPPLPRAAADVSRVLDLRAEGLSAFSRATKLATSGGASAARPLFAHAGADLLAADAAYAALRRHLGRLASDVPRDGWTADGGGSPRTIAAGALRAGAMADYSSRLASIAALRSRPGLTLAAISLDPPPYALSGLPRPTTTTTSTTTTTTTTTTLPFPPGTTTTTTSTTTTTTTPPPTTTLQILPPGAVAELYATTRVWVLVIVENSGNVALGGARVVATLEPSGASARRSLGPLAVGTARYVRIGPFEVRRDERYRLLVRASAPSTGATRSVSFAVRS